MVVIEMLSALAQPTRLAAMTLLVEADRTGMTVGDLADRLAVPANTMSTHLAVLARAGLIEPRRSGRCTIYRSVPEVVAKLIDLLIRQLCLAEPPPSFEQAGPDQAHG